MIAWDYNLAFGGMGMGAMGGGDGATSSVNSPIDSPVSSGELSERPMVATHSNITKPLMILSPPILKAAILRSSSRKPWP